MLPLVWAAMGLIAASESGKFLFQMQSARAKQAALELQSKQLRLQRNEKMVANYDQVQRVLEAQEAMQTVRGTAFSSPSFNAIQRDTVNVGGRKGQNILLESEIQQNAIDVEKSNVRSTLWAQLFGDVAEGASAMIGVANAAPKASAASKLPRLED